MTEYMYMYISVYTSWVGGAKGVIDEIHGGGYLRGAEVSVTVHKMAAIVNTTTGEETCGTHQYLSFTLVTSYTSIN